MIVKTINLDNQYIVEENEKLIVTIGAFDALHIGHKKLFSELINEKMKRGHEYKTAVITFSKHPDFYLNKREENNILETDYNKLQSFSDYNLDYVFLLEKEVLSLTYQDFHRQILDAINTEIVIVGKDFKYGYKALGNVNTLAAEYIVKSYLIKNHTGDKVSSSEIRELLKCGNVEETNRLLGRNYFIESNNYKVNDNNCILYYNENMVRLCPGLYKCKLLVDNYCEVINANFKTDYITFELNDILKSKFAESIKLEIISRIGNAL
jgi:FAD synthase